MIEVDDEEDHPTRKTLSRDVTHILEDVDDPHSDDDDPPPLADMSESEDEADEDEEEELSTSLKPDCICFLQAYPRHRVHR